jgi:hypothetical protein
MQYSTNAGNDFQRVAQDIVRAEMRALQQTYSAPEHSVLLEKMQLVSADLLLEMQNMPVDEPQQEAPAKPALFTTVANPKNVQLRGQVASLQESVTRLEEEEALWAQAKREADDEPELAVPAPSPQAAVEDERDENDENAAPLAPPPAASPSPSELQDSIELFTAQIRTMKQALKTAKQVNQKALQSNSKAFGLVHNQAFDGYKAVFNPKSSIRFLACKDNKAPKVI